MRNSEHNPLGFSLSVRNWNEDLGVHIKHYKIEYFPKNIKKTLVYMFIMHSFWEPLFVVMRIVYQHIRGFWHSAYSGQCNCLSSACNAQAECM